MAANINEALDSLEEYLEYLKQEGQSFVEVDRSTLAELGRMPAASGSSIDTMETITTEIAKCKKCSLHKTRTNTVPGDGSYSPEIMFIGEAPGADEDAQGIPFVGRAGKLLTKMIEAMGYKRDEIYIGNILKCRPPENRKPTPDEMATCLPYLKRQIAQLQPKVIIALGATAVHGLVETDEVISKLRGNWMEFEGIKLMPTFHPAYLLRNQKAKVDVWADLQEVLKVLGKKPPERS